MKYTSKLILFNALISLLLFTSAQAQDIVNERDSVILAQDTIKKTIITTHYHKKFEGRKTTSGERYRGSKLTAAHRTLPFGTMVKVENPKNGKSVWVKINDRGPFSKRYSLDVSMAAAKILGFSKHGSAKVIISYVLKNKQ